MNALRSPSCTKRALSFFFFFFLFSRFNTSFQRYSSLAFSTSSFSSTIFYPLEDNEIFLSGAQQRVNICGFLRTREILARKYISKIILMSLGLECDDTSFHWEIAVEICIFSN